MSLVANHHSHKSLFPLIACSICTWVCGMWLSIIMRCTSANCERRTIRGSTSGSFFPSTLPLACFLYHLDMWPVFIIQASLILLDLLRFSVAWPTHLLGRT
ncbi:hypothetical protein BDV19DRAFT_369557 [Aspergillus venezuelensis]